MRPPRSQICLIFSLFPLRPRTSPCHSVTQKCMRSGKDISLYIQNQPFTPEWGMTARCREEAKWLWEEKRWNLPTCGKEKGTITASKVCFIGILFNRDLPMPDQEFEMELENWREAKEVGIREGHIDQNVAVENVNLDEGNFCKSCDPSLKDMVS